MTKVTVNVVDKQMLYDKNPLISVVIPTYNSGDYITETLKSVFLQSYNNFEVIVSDDGSSDNTEEEVQNIFKQFTHKKTVLLTNSHQGPGATRNAGIRQASGDWIAFLDSDDLWFPSKLATVSEAICQHPKANFFCHNEEHLHLDNTKTILDYSSKYCRKVPLPKQLFLRCFFSTSAVVCRKSLLLRRGLFNETLMSAQDYELWLRLSPYIHVYFIREFLGRYIDRPGNISSMKLERRMLNLLRIHFLHRHKVDCITYLYSLIRNAIIYAVLKNRQFHNCTVLKH